MIGDFKFMFNNDWLAKKQLDVIHFYKSRLNISKEINSDLKSLVTIRM